MIEIFDWKWWHGNEAMGKACGNCPCCLFPAALVSSGLSLCTWAGPAVSESAAFRAGLAQRSLLCFPFPVTGQPVQCSPVVSWY